jgi:hypothetical protein
MTWNWKNDTNQKVILSKFAKGIFNPGESILRIVIWIIFDLLIVRNPFNLSVVLKVGALRLFEPNWKRRNSQTWNNTLNTHGSFI